MRSASFFTGWNRIGMLWVPARTLRDSARCLRDFIPGVPVNTPSIWNASRASRTLSQSARDFCPEFPGR